MGGEHPDWLPVGWRVSVKVRSFGRKDKYYVHPSNGLTFNSKPEVLRYLKSSGKFQKPKELNKLDAKKTAAEQLPPGWIKEIRTKKRGRKTIRGPYYIDPVSGRQFRSMQEVFRYLKSKDSGEAVSEPDDKGHIRVESGEHSQSSSAEAKGPRLIDKRADKILTGHESIKSGPNVAALEKIENPVLEQRHKTDDYAAVGSLPNKPPQRNGKECGGRRQSRRLADSKLKDNVDIDHSITSGSKSVTEKNIIIPETNGLELREKENSCKEDGQQQEKLVPKSKRKSSTRTSNLPRRTSKRLACLEVDPLIEVKTMNEAEALAKLSVARKVDVTKMVGKSGLSDEPQTDSTGESGRFNDPNKQPSKHQTENPTNNKQNKPITSENLSSHEEENCGDVDCNEDQNNQKHPDSSLNDLLLMDPCIEFAIKTLTGAIPIEDVNKVGDSRDYSLASPNQTSAYGNIWSDPCFEFAVKTLTGEMPTDDGSQFQISLQKPLG